MFSRYLIIISFLSTILLYSQNTASYIKADGNTVRIGNSSIERVITISPEFKGTTEITNKLSGIKYNVHSDEFELHIIWGGTDHAFGKMQNGENPAGLTAKDFKYIGYDKTEKTGGVEELSLNFQMKSNHEDILLSVKYEVYPDKPCMRKWIELADNEYGLHFLDRIEIESISFEKSDFSHGAFGQPVFNKDVFIGVEYPTVENNILGSSLKCGYVVGQSVKKDAYISHSSVMGVSGSEKKLENAFMKYVEDIKVNGTRQFLLYNSWYDIRNPEDIDVKNNPASTMSIDNIKARANEFKNLFVDKYSIHLDAFVLDDGWDNINSYWDIDTSRFPAGFSPIMPSLSKLNTGLGLWSSPFGGYTNRKVRSKWAKDNGYETTDDFICFSGIRGKVKYKEQMVNLTKKYNIGYFKWDGFLLACNETGHGHLPGIYSREANVSNYIDVMNAVRKVNPNIYLNITTGTWLSPWWLQYADCIWMQGLDYAYAEDVPCVYERDKSITYKDAILWDNYQNQHLLFPMSSLMTHGIIKGQLALIGGEKEEPEAFANDVMMYFGRGVMMCELYLTPSLLSDSNWNSIASTIEWAKENKAVLENTKMILGNPLKREPYGYIHESSKKGILLLRNPDVCDKTVKIKISDFNGDLNPSDKYYVKIIYPYNLIMPDMISTDKEFSIKLNGYEVLAAEIISKDEINKNLPAGIKYELDEGILNVFGNSDSNVKVKALNGKTIGEAGYTVPVSGIKFSKNNLVINKDGNYETQIEINLSKQYKNPKLGLLLEPGEKLAKDSIPEFQVTINGESKKLKTEEENGKWFWVLTDLTVGKNNVSYKVKFKRETKCKISTWIFSDYELKKTTLGRIPGNNEELLPAKPYSGNIQKLIVPISEDKF